MIGDVQYSPITVFSMRFVSFVNRFNNNKNNSFCWCVVFFYYVEYSETFWNPEALIKTRSLTEKSTAAIWFSVCFGVSRYQLCSDRKSREWPLVYLSQLSYLFKYHQMAQVIIAYNSVSFRIEKIITLIFICQWLNSLIWLLTETVPPCSYENQSCVCFYVV